MDSKQAEGEPNVDEESSNLEYLGNQQGVEEGSRDEGNSTRRRGREWEKESEVRRVLINNRAKDKKVETDSAYDGIYLYKPGVELPSLYQFTNQNVAVC